MNLAAIKKMLGENYNVAQRANGQFSIGIATNRLKDTVDAAKVRERVDAHAKLQAQWPSIPDFDTCFKAGNPPRGDEDRDKDNKPIWRQYLHLLIDGAAASAPVQADPGFEYLRMLLATGMDPVKAAQTVMQLKSGGAVPAPTSAPAVPAGVVDGDETVPV